MTKFVHISLNLNLKNAKIYSKAYDVSKILNFSNVMTFNKQIVLCSKRLSEHFQFNKVDNNNHIVPMNTTTNTFLDIDINNTFPQPMLN